MEKSQWLLQFIQMEQRKWLWRADMQCSNRPLSKAPSNLDSSAEGVIRLLLIGSSIRFGWLTGAIVAVRCPFQHK